MGCAASFSHFSQSDVNDNNNTVVNEATLEDDISNTARDSINPDEKNIIKTKSISFENNNEFNGVFKGQQLLCRDEFFSKYTNEKMYRWRQTEIVQINEKSRAMLHFIGWAETFDHWVDFKTDFLKIAPIGLLPKSQCDKGELLSENQLLISAEYFKTGKFPGREDSNKQLNTKTSESKLSIEFDNQASDNMETSTVSSSRPNSRASSANRINRMRAPLPTGKSITNLNDNTGGNANRVYTKGELIDVQDIYLKKGHTQHSFKWRKAQVIGIAGNTIRIHYVDWDSKFDENIDLINDYKRISDYGTKSTIESPSRGSSASSNVTRRNTADLATEEITNSEQDDRSRLSSRVKRYNSVSTPSAIHIDMPVAQEILLSEKNFADKLSKRGFSIKPVDGDGNCLFRAVAHQLFLDDNRHVELRENCVNHLVENKKRFEMFCDESFDDHIKEMRLPGTWADDLEIRALEEITDRLICIYSSHVDNVDEPSNKNFEEDVLLKDVLPINLTYHGQSHYNSLVDNKNNNLPLNTRQSTILYDNRKTLFEELMSPDRKDNNNNNNDDDNVKDSKADNNSSKSKS